MGFRTWSASGLSAQPPASFSYSHHGSREPEDSRPGGRDVSGVRVRLTPQVRARVPTACLRGVAWTSHFHQQPLTERQVEEARPAGRRRAGQARSSWTLQPTWTPPSPLESPRVVKTQSSRAGPERHPSAWHRSGRGECGRPCAPAGLSLWWVGRSRRVQKHGPLGWMSRLSSVGPALLHGLVPLDPPVVLPGTPRHSLPTLTHCQQPCPPPLTPRAWHWVAC